MKRSALDFLVCPACRESLDLHARAEEGAEVMSGTLSCRGCGAEFPVLRGVPRFLGTSTYAASFGDQWNWFRDVQLDSRNGTRESEGALYATSGWSEQDYRGRLVLDAGVGAGRYAEVVANKGGEVVGFDLTNAVDAAFENIGRDERVHLIQANIFAMPFREGSFDMAYSIGVLHHTPDTRMAFSKVAAMVKEGGEFATYLYHAYGPANRCADIVRQLTTRLPLKLMYVLSAASIPLYYIYRLPLLGKILRILLPISMHRRWRWRWLDTFDWYTPRYQWKYQYPEIYAWFREEAFGDIHIFKDPIRMRGTRMPADSGRDADTAENGPAMRPRPAYRPCGNLALHEEAGGK